MAPIWIMEPIRIMEDIAIMAPIGIMAPSRIISNVFPLSAKLRFDHFFLKPNFSNYGCGIVVLLDLLRCSAGKQKFESKSDARRQRDRIVKVASASLRELKNVYIIKYSI